MIPQARIDQHLEARILCLSHIEVPIKAGLFSDITIVVVVSSSCII